MNTSIKRRSIKRTSIKRISIKRSLLAVALTLSFCVMARRSNPVRATTCGDLGLFALPASPKQGDTVTVFVSLTNNAAFDPSFVVVTELFGQLIEPVATDVRAIEVLANSTVVFQFTFQTSSETPPGSYEIFAQSYQGTLPACGNCFCSHASIHFTLACNSNNCNP